MGLAMLLLAVLEGLAQGNAGLLARVVFVNLPLAFIATSVAYAVVQLLLVATDGLCHAIASASGDNSQHFFKAAITGLGEAGGSAGKEVGGRAGGPVGEVAGQAEGTAAVPLFVTFLAAIIGAFAAFMVWLELLMRDAAIYVVALFMPLALAASIWPRWSGALRRTGELLVVVIGSKFVIVSIISLAAGLVAENDGRVEHILAAAALMLLACFAPFVLLKLVPFAEGAMGAAYGRRSAAGGAMSGVQIASDVQILRNMAQSNFGESGATLWKAGGQGGGSPGPEPSAPRGGGPVGGGGAAGGGSGARWRWGQRRRQRRRGGGGGRSGSRRRGRRGGGRPGGGDARHQSRRPAPGGDRASPSRRAAQREAERQRRNPSRGAPIRLVGQQRKVEAARQREQERRRPRPRAGRRPEPASSRRDRHRSRRRPSLRRARNRERAPLPLRPARAARRGRPAARRPGRDRRQRRRPRAGLALRAAQRLSASSSGVLALCFAVAAVCVPIEGRTPEEWAPVVGRWLHRRKRAERGHRSTAPDVRLAPGRGRRGRARSLAAARARRPEAARRSPTARPRSA